MVEICGRARAVVLSGLLALVAACGATPECTPLTSGTWQVYGAGFGMSMSTELSFDESRCRFTLDEWSMSHGSEATGGAVDLDEVRLEGTTEYWSSCVGRVTDGVYISGICEESGGAFEMETSGG